MFRLSRLVVIAAFVLGAPGVAAAQTWTDWGEADGRALLAAENGVVSGVETGAEGELLLYGVVDGWLQVALIGSDCEGAGAKLRCKALGLNAVFEVNDAVRARALQEEMEYQYVADLADGGDLVIHRQIELGGGASLANIRAQVNGFVVVGELVHARIWPAKGNAAPAKADRLNRSRR